MSKPNIYAFCEAGCKWEVPHKDETLPVYYSTSNSEKYIIYYAMKYFGAKANNDRGGYEVTFVMNCVANVNYLVTIHKIASVVYNVKAMLIGGNDYNIKVVNSIVSYSSDPSTITINDIKDDTIKTYYLKEKPDVATTAEYASEDKTKGTIEERLTALGFKEGVAALEGVTATSNTLTKKGKYVIFNFNGTLKAGTSGKITIPNEFKPKENIIFFLGQDTGLLGVVGLLAGIENGVITLNAPANDTPITIYNLGWEIN